MLEGTIKSGLRATTAQGTEGRGGTKGCLKKNKEAFPKKRK